MSSGASRQSRPVRSRRPARALALLALGIAVLVLPASGANTGLRLSAPLAMSAVTLVRPHALTDLMPHDHHVAVTIESLLRDWAPARLVIPKMGLDAPFLALGPAPDGSMQAPVVPNPHSPLYGEVYWWDVGAMPGQVGNAVLAGHINRPDGSPASFGNLNLLAPGDDIEVITAAGYTLTFVVTAKETPSVYTRGDNDPTIERIFGPALTANLNLLTCWGKWDGKTYDRRLTIYSTLVGPSPFPPQ